MLQEISCSSEEGAGSIDHNKLILDPFLFLEISGGVSVPILPRLGTADIRWVTLGWHRMSCVREA